MVCFRASGRAPGKDFEEKQGLRKKKNPGPASPGFSEIVPKKLRRPAQVQSLEDGHLRRKPVAWERYARGPHRYSSACTDLHRAQWHPGHCRLGNDLSGARCAAAVVDAMSVRPVSSFFPTSQPEAGLYEGLVETPATRRLPLVERSEAERRPRALSEAQRRTLLGDAADRIKQEAKTRAARFLRRLDTRHSSGCRTKQQVWNNLSALSEPLLARLDLATMSLGWLDLKTGQFRVNRQRGLAEDTGLSECAVSRTLAALEASGYVYRKVSRIYKHGKNWVTRVLIRLRPRFFIDLGLGYQLSQERTRRRNKRAKHLAALGQRSLDIATRQAAEKRERQSSHKAGKAAHRARQDKARAMDKDAYARGYSERRLAFKLAHPDLKGLAFESAYGRAHPEYAIHPDQAYRS